MNQLMGLLKEISEGAERGTWARLPVETGVAFSGVVDRWTIALMRHEEHFDGTASCPEMGWLVRLTPALAKGLFELAARKVKNATWPCAVCNTPLMITSGSRYCSILCARKGERTWQRKKKDVL
jgi:hypothetical protein